MNNKLIIMRSLCLCLIIIIATFCLIIYNNYQTDQLEEQTEKHLIRCKTLCSELGLEYGGCGSSDGIELARCCDGNECKGYKMI